MSKLMLLFRRPADVVDFETRWSQEFVPKIEKVPGLRRVAVTRVTGGATGPVDLHLVHEFFFDNPQAVRHAMTSPEGQAAGRSLMSFAADHVTLCVAEHLEESR